MGRGAIVVLAIIYHTTNVGVSADFSSDFWDFKVNDYRFIVAIGTPEQDQIFGLGSIISLTASKTAIISTASCFDDHIQYDYYDHVDRPMHDNESQRSMRNMRRTLSAKVHRRKTEMGDGSGDDGGGNSTDTTDQGSTDDDNSRKPIKYSSLDNAIFAFSLYRIDINLRQFVRLPLDVLNLAHPADFEKLADVQLWRFDVALLFTGELKDVTELQRLRSTELFFKEFGDYVKSLDGGMVNTLSCQVIGLIEYADNGSYTPKDTNVKLVAQTVLVDFDECRNPICSQRKAYCHSTGQHIYKDRKNPLPYVISGSPLVCDGKVLSVVNIHSHCDESRYSAEFLSSEDIRRFAAGFPGFIEEARDLSTFTIPTIPYPKWAKDASPQSMPVLGSLHSALAITVNLFRNQILGTTY